jgi:hypothetical protein
MIYPQRSGSEPVGLPLHSRYARRSDVALGMDLSCRTGEFGNLAGISMSRCALSRSQTARVRLHCGIRWAALGENFI